MTDGSLGGNVRREPRESVRPPGRAVSCLRSEQAETRARVTASKVVRVALAVAGMAPRSSCAPSKTRKSEPSGPRCPRAQ
jgi:hypothetical protein